MCANGLWGRVCNRLQYWGPDNARVVCRQLGFPTDGKNLICHFVCFKSHSKKDAHVVEGEVARMFGVSERAPLLGEVHCIGTEAELLECSHSSIGRHLCGITLIPPVRDIVISCFGTIVYLTWDLCCLCSPGLIISCEYSLMYI